MFCIAVTKSKSTWENLGKYKRALHAAILLFDKCAHCLQKSACASMDAVTQTHECHSIHLNFSLEFPYPKNTCIRFNCNRSVRIMCVRSCGRQWFLCHIANACANDPSPHKKYLIFHKAHSQDGMRSVPKVQCGTK